MQCAKNSSITKYNIDVKCVHCMAVSTRQVAVHESKMISNCALIMQCAIDGCFLRVRLKMWCLCSLKVIGLQKVDIEGMGLVIYFQVLYGVQKLLAWRI